MSIRILFVGSASEMETMRYVEKQLIEANNGIEITIVTDMGEGLKVYQEQEFTIIAINIFMENSNIRMLLTSIRQMRSSYIFIASPDIGDDDVITLYEFGADLVISYHFQPQVALAYFEAFYRRLKICQQKCNLEGIKSSSSMMFRDGMTINPHRRSVTVNNVEKILTVKEFDLLYFLARNADKVQTHQKIYENVWSEKYGDCIDLTSYISRLRQKIEPDPNNPTFIITRYGTGYMFSSK